MPRLSLPAFSRRVFAPTDISKNIMFKWAPTSLRELRAAEDGLLRESGAKVYDVHLKSGLKVHTAEILPKSPTSATAPLYSPSETPLVLAHGFGMGIGGWFRNYGQLAQRHRVLAIDWLGMGLSSRPEFTARGVQESEQFFVQSLEAWRQTQGIEKMNLLGHSLGGYLATAYADRYPNRVQRLILASPVGVTAKPENDGGPVRQGSLLGRVVFRVLHGMWNNGVTPQGLIRTMGPYGPRIIEKYMNNRWSDVTEEKRAHLANYLYHNAAVSSSGENCLSQLLLPAAWPVEPLLPRLNKMRIPITFIYGDRDWMNMRGGAVLPEVLGHKQTIKVIQLENAGHMLFLDNPEGFNALVTDTISQKQPILSKKISNAVLLSQLAVNVAT